MPVYGVGCERGVHYYAMQYIEGQTLAAVIQELRLGERGCVGALPSTLHPKVPLFSETLDERIHLLTGIGAKGMTTGPALARESVERIE